MNPQRFADSLPTGPLVGHVRSLHSTLIYQGARGDVLAVSERSLRDVAVYTAHHPTQPPGNEMIRATLVEHFPEWNGSLTDLHRILHNAVSSCSARCQGSVATNG
jgi:hypothetical protein